MRIIIDGRSSRTGGGQTYLRNLLRSDLPSDVSEVILFAPASLGCVGANTRIRIVQVPELLTRPVLRAVVGDRWVQRACQAEHSDVVLFAGGSVPRRATRGCVRVTMARNMLPFSITERQRYRLGYIRLRLFLLQHRLVSSANRADYVIMVSDLARETLGRRVTGVLDRSVVITHGVVQDLTQSARGVRPSWLPERYCVYVSNVEPYKRQIEVVQAYAELKVQVPDTGSLLLVGPLSSKWYAKRVRREVRSLGLERDILLTGEVANTDLPMIYREAAFGVFASSCEACPNALLEAMSSGLALVVSTARPMPDFAGDAVLYCDPTDPSSISKQMVKLSTDPGLRRTLKSRAKERASEYRWEETAARTWRLLTELAEV